MNFHRICLLIGILLSGFITTYAQDTPIIRSARITVYKAVQKDTIWTTGNIVDNIYFVKYDNEGHAIICGFEYSPIRQIRISPNYQSWKSSKGKRENFLLLSVECKI